MPCRAPTRVSSRLSVPLFLSARIGRSSDCLPKVAASERQSLGPLCAKLTERLKLLRAGDEEGCLSAFGYPGGMLPFARTPGRRGNVGCSDAAEQKGPNADGSPICSGRGGAKGGAAHRRALGRERASTKESCATVEIQSKKNFGRKQSMNDDFE